MIKSDIQYCVSLILTGEQTKQYRMEIIEPLINYWKSFPNDKNAAAGDRCVTLKSGTQVCYNRGNTNYKII